MVKNFGQLSSGETAHLYSLMTDMLRICVTDFGGTLVSVEVKDKSGKFVDITLGYDDVAEDLKLQSLLRNVTILVQAAFRLQSESLLPDSEFHLIRFLKSMKVLMEQSLPFLNHRKEWLL